MKTALKRLAIAASLVGVLAGCATPRPLPPVVLPVFDLQVALDQLKDGPNRIKGSAVLRRNDGAAITCAGSDVWLVPATKYARARIMALYGGVTRGYRDARMPAPNMSDDQLSLYRSAWRTTTCDAQGFFSFANVKDGEFYVVTSITWMNGAQGGNLMHQISLSGGETKEVVLTY